MKIKNITGSITLLATLLASQFTYAKTEIVFSHYLPKDYVEKMVDEFEKQNPEIDINVMSCGFRDCHDKLTTALAVGEGAPDVVSISTIKLGSFVNAGGLTDLSSAPYNITDSGWAFDQSMLTLSEDKQGDIFGVPFDTGPVVMVYRKDLVDLVGADIDDVTKDWDSFIAFAEQIKQKNGAYILPAATSLINPLVMGTNSQPGQTVYLKDGEPNLASDEIKGLVKLVKELYDKELVAALDGSSNDQKFIKLFREGKLFADVDGPWIEGRILQEYDPEGAKSGLWRVSGIPNNTNVNAGGTVFAMPKQGQHKPEAWKFIQFLMEQDNVLDIAKVAGTLPARMEVYSDPFFDQPSEILGGQHSMKYYTEIVKNIKPYSASPVDNIANSILNDAIKKIVAQDADVDSTLEDANRLLKRRMRTL